MKQSLPRGYSFSSVLTFWLIFEFGFVGLAFSQTAADSDQPTSIKVSFVDVKQHIYDGVIELPATKNRNGYAVLMLGGGLSNGLDWEVPPILSSSGEWIRDGKTLSDAIVNRGFAVMRWRAIYRGDKKFAESPLMVDSPTFPESVEHARLALETLRKAKIVDTNKVFLLGHSLGVRRASILLDENPKLPGVVSLAGASLVSTDKEMLMEMTDRARAEFEKLDKNKNGELTKDEGAGPTLLALRNPSRVHDYIGWRLTKQPKNWFVPKALDRFGFRFGSDVISERRTPTLAIVGSLDRRWLAEHYALAALQEDRLEARLEFRFCDGLGHQLGKEERQQVVHPKFGVISDVKLEPISDEVVATICDWLQKQVAIRVETDSNSK